MVESYSRATIADMVISAIIHRPLTKSATWGTNAIRLSLVTSHC